MTSICKIDGCDRPIRRIGLCSPHYYRVRKYGTPEAGGTIRGAPAEWLEAQLAYEGDECLRWPFSTNSYGYGYLVIDGKRQAAHRYVCEKTKGPCPSPDHEAAHSCGNGNVGCVTKRHLRWATISENQLERAVHGTSNRGAQNAQCKLSETEVLAIRRAHASGVRNCDIAEQLGTNPRTVSDVINRRTWAWLEPMGEAA